MGIFVRSFQKFLSTVVLAGAAATLMPIAASAAVTNCGGLTNLKVVAIAGIQSTTSKTFVDMPGSTVTVDPNIASCLVVDLSAQMRAAAPKTIRVRVMLDGPKVAFPASADFRTSEQSYDARSAIFVFPRVTAGHHTINVQFLSVDGSDVTMTKSVMRITYDNGIK
jgi:hypothetical protein